ncbi:DNA-directed RNA polymerase II subunit GRINL1A-like [Acanthaster planci]|uniref:DNA-directed RNA polymerase II subunit GRINL1A-like n=1 Tax=Acanthaster planci TaxID=133434 RepID=A0A8B7YV10_ACAPL|nr:DNA-directed RNA polymerase II subunit GRINL1A-like [Acanthaster planci]
MDRQGDMGDLKTKTKAELVDLLNRQEKLLANKKMLSMLPDKGEKVTLQAERLRELIAQHETMVDVAADLLEKMDIGAPQGVRQAPENVFLKVDCRPVVKKTPFKPFRTLHMDRIPEGLERPPAPPSRGSTPMAGIEDRPPEVSAVAIPPLKHPGTQAIEVKAAAELLEKQRAKVQALQAEQAAERLAERQYIQMGRYQPDSPGRYREHGADDSDDDNMDDDEDYSDDGKCKEESYLFPLDNEIGVAPEILRPLRFVLPESIDHLRPGSPVSDTNSLYVEPGSPKSDTGKWAL